MADMPASEPVNSVDGPRLMAHCALFAERMKLSGTPDELASMERVQALLDGFGYRTTLHSHPAYISLPGTASVTVDGVKLRCITHSFSRPGRVSGRVVHVGEGTAADFAAHDLHGAIVLADGIASPAVAARARDAGAAGQLHISPHEHLHEMCISPVWGSPGATTLAQLPATVACTISQADGAALRDRIAHGGTPEVVLTAEVDTGWRPTPLLVAELGPPGDDPGDEADGPFILFSGHHDTWFYGVMDNGSANATMLECARVLALRRATWRRGLRLCFWSGHSHGRYSGSSWYVDNHWEELERRCAVHVNVDSTGAVGATVLSEAAAAPELAAVAAQAIAAETNAGYEGKRNARNSDMSFWGVGVPAMLGSLSHQPAGGPKMRNPLGWWWHTPEDLLDKIDEANLVRDTRVFARVLWRLLTDEVLPLDYAAHLDALLAELHGLEAGLNGRLSLQPAIEAAQRARTGVAVLAGEPAAVNATLMRLSRALVPMENTLGDRFVHDPALPQSSWPVLDALRALARAEDDQNFATVDAIRARNRLVQSLHQVTRALNGP